MPPKAQTPSLPRMRIAPHGEILVRVCAGERLLATCGVLEVREQPSELVWLDASGELPAQRLGEGEAAIFPTDRWLSLRNPTGRGADCLLLPAPRAGSAWAAALVYYARWAAARTHPLGRSAPQLEHARSEVAPTQPCGK